MRAFALVAMVLVLIGGCASSKQSVSSSELAARSDDALRLQSMCAVRNVKAVDDGISDAQSVALALCLACSREYQNATEAFGLANLDNEAQRRMFRERRNRTQEKIESFLPFVMEYRSQKNNR